MSSTAAARRLDQINRHVTVLPCVAGAPAQVTTAAPSMLGKRILLTGGGSGIGRGVALAFARAGGAVVIAGRRKDALLATAAELSADSAGRIVPYCTDIADAAAVAELVAFATDTLGAVDILVNNAGINIPARGLAELSVPDWTRVVNVNLNGTFHVIHSLLPAMRTRKEGVIINVTSIAGRTATTLAGAAYCASKFGMNALGDAINLEEHTHGIRCTNICPGEVATELLDKRAHPPSQETRALMLQPEDVAAAAIMVAALPPRAHVPTVVLTGKTTIERGGVPMW